jgi:magnesium transporter
MITIYKNSEIGLANLPEATGGCWLNVVDPTAEEINCLQKLGIPQDYITYPLDLDERPRTERENGDLLIILRIPYAQGAHSDIPFTTIPLGLILNNQFIITVCKRDNEILQYLTSGRMRDLSTSKRNRFTLRVLLLTAQKYLQHLREMTKVIEGLEDELQRSIRNREVLELLKYEKSLTYFTTALKSNELMMERLQRSQLFKMYPDDEDLLEDVLTENQQAIEMTNIESNILSGMMDAFASIISNNQNTIIKLLTSITIVLSFPTIVSSFFGMNVDLPFQGHPLAYIYVLLIAIGLGLGVTFVLRKLDWF